jgi:hypothetical protein
MQHRPVAHTLLALLAVAACGDSGGRASDSAATAVSTTLTTVGTSSSGGGATSESATEVVTGGGSVSASATGGSTTENTTLPGTSTGSVSASSSSSGGGMLCNPGAVQCKDGLTIETCADDGQSWGNPTPCGDKQQCEAGQCLTLCQKADAALSSIGCEYYAVDTNNDPIEGYDSQPYAVVVSNVDPQYTANVAVQAHDGNAWQTIQMATVAPKMLYQFDLPDRHVDYTNLNARGAYKVVSDVPIIAYQFQPVNGESSYTSDASLLLPKTTFDTFYYVIGWGKPSFGNAQINIVAAQDGTNVMITPAVATTGGGPIPALSPGQPAALPTMNEGDVIQIEAGDSFSGTFLTSDKPIAVFSTHWCANVPQQVCCCDHLEEQVYGLQKWGTSYVGARWPVRNTGGPEPSVWHLFASEDNTQVTVAAHAEVTGIPNPNFTMSKGQLMLLSVGGSEANPGDFLVTADKPIYLMQYLSSSQTTNAPTDKAGDPAMAQAVPVEQFRDNYVILIPSNWIYDFIVVTKKTGATVNVDGQPIPQASFVPVGPAGMPTGYEVARIPASDGVHSLDGDQTFGVTVLGYDSYDSYAYPGGLDQKQINPQ